MIAMAQDKTYKFDWIYNINNDTMVKNNETSFYCEEN